MEHEEFDALLEDMIEHIRNTLGLKAEEYATEDRLHNFKKSAHIIDGTPMQACWGFAAKHLVSISDMVSDSAEGLAFPEAVWNEKIGDAINYLILLKALVRENQVGSTDKFAAHLQRMKVDKLS